MTYEKAKEILRAFPNVKAITVAGFGEPTTSLQFSLISELLRDKRAFLYTNGLRPSVSFEPYNAVRVSVNEIDRELYRQRCGVDGFPRVEETLLRLRISGNRFSCSFVISPENASRCAEYVLWSEARGARTVQLISVCDPSCDSWPLEGCQREIERQRRSLDGLVSVAVRWPRKPPRLERWQGCAMVLNSLYVDAYGHVSVCCRGEGPREELGNFTDGFHSDALEEFRDLVWSKSQPGKCRTCNEPSPD